ncbi:MAG: HigA family addiction module antitoxin [Cyanobacteria bacterium MAG CAR3_bin_5]|nr:HigA family addiction module antitoxin [Cyanobacteria bacterium MAG CAR3_bin_5]
MSLHNPPHPGGVIRRQCLEPTGLTIPQAAQNLGITRQSLTELLNERKGLSPEMASRLAEVFGSTAETWLGMQMAYDQWQAHGVSSHETRNSSACDQALVL